MGPRGAEQTLQCCSSDSSAAWAYSHAGHVQDDGSGAGPGDVTTVRLGLGFVLGRVVAVRSAAEESLSEAVPALRCGGPGLGGVRSVDEGEEEEDEEEEEEEEEEDWLRALGGGVRSAAWPARCGGGGGGVRGPTAAWEALRGVSMSLLSLSSDAEDDVASVPVGGAGGGGVRSCLRLSASPRRSAGGPVGAAAAWSGEGGGLSRRMASWTGMVAPVGGGGDRGRGARRTGDLKR